MQSLEDLRGDDRHALQLAATRLRQQSSRATSQVIEQLLVRSYDRISQDAKITAFLPLIAERATRQQLRVLGMLRSDVEERVPTVAFLCVHNAGRSQMAAAWFNQLAGGRAAAWAGGSEPAEVVSPAAVAVMAEVGIDISRQVPRRWPPSALQAADVVVTMGCREACPVLPGQHREDWDMDDPSALDLDGVRRIRDEIEGRVRNLLDRLGVEGH